MTIPPEVLAKMEEIEKNSDVIPVRALVDGKWQNIMLCDAPGTIAIEHAFKWIRALSKEGL